MEITRISKYCNKCVYDANVVNGIARIDYNNIQTAKTLTTVTGSTNVTTVEPVDITLDNYGCVVSVVSSVASRTEKVVVKGYDYYDQPMTEEIQLNGTTAVDGKKAFKIIKEVVVGLGAAQVITIKSTTKQGIPLRATKVLAGILNGSNAEFATLTVSQNSEQSTTTPDPRGTVLFTGVNDGDKATLICAVDNSTVTINGEEVGGLQGNPHFFA